MTHATPAVIIRGPAPRASSRLSPPDRPAEAAVDQLVLPPRSRFEGPVRVVEGVALLTGFAAVVLGLGHVAASPTVRWELDVAGVVAMAVLTGALVVRNRTTLLPQSWWRSRWPLVAVCGVWLAGAAMIPLLRRGNDFAHVALWTDLCLAARLLLAGLAALAAVGERGANPGLLLAGSFVVLIALGTGLLSLPVCRAAGGDYSFRTALFTATSAGCVTGLTVVDTGGPRAYWTPTGHAVIAGLFQIGGLGIMTCGALLAVAAGRGLRVRESAALGELFDAETAGDVRTLAVSILAFTAAFELTGAVLLAGHWPDLPFRERLGWGLFHSVSAFCNAGFDLTGHSFVGDGTRWRVWAVLPVLIVSGGLGFGTWSNLAARLRPAAWAPRPRSPLRHPAPFRRLTVTTRLVLWVTAGLTAFGFLGNFFFEADWGGTGADRSLAERVADAWFQTVTFRTAGFNTVPLDELRPASKLFAIVQMFIGASPVSTGGGIKTVVFAVTVLTVVATLRGRPRVEVFGRTVPEEAVRRAFLVLALGVTAVVVTTLLLTLFEPIADVRFLDLLFESTSAFGTVGVSSAGTASLTPASQYVLIVTMFLGRVGPLTLLLGVAGGAVAGRFEYPEERPTLG